MFYEYLGVGNYLYEQSKKINTKNDFEQIEKISLPIAIDTEFFSDRRKCITVQMKDIHNKKGDIFCHQDFDNYCKENNKKIRHKVLKEDFAVFDYLKDKGYPIRIKNNFDYSYDKDEDKILYIDLYAHFAIAELLMIVNNKLKSELKDIIKHSGSRFNNIGLKIPEQKKYLHINQNRRLQLSTKTFKGKFIEDSIQLPYYLEMYGQWYNVKLRYFDTSGLHGISSYADLAQSTGIKLKYKDSLSQYDKENMQQTYFNKPNDFDNYSLGDLEIYEILKNNAILFQNINDNLGIKNNKIPSLTAGSTVQKLFFNKLLSYFYLEDNKENIKLIEKLCSYGSASVLKENINDTSSLLSKVHGGRCRNNNPLTHSYEGLLVDNDIDGCYGNGLRLQSYPIGKPIIESYSINTSNNYLTLKNWLKKRKYNTDKNELDYGLWHCVVDTIEPLKYSQDLVASWFNFKVKNIPKINNSDNDNENEIDPKSGITKIFRNEIKNGVITDDFLDYLFYVCNHKQRNELLNKLIVKSSIYYPTFSQVKTLNELKELLTNKDELSQEINKNKKISKTNIKTAWIKINLDSLIVDTLLAERKKYLKKTPLNTLYKLTINSLYGVFCSPFFNVSNCVVGNNITARARFMCYLMEKGHNMQFSITDGGIFDINKVVYPLKNNYLSASNCIDLYQYNERDINRIRHLKLAPLDNAKKIESNGCRTTITYENSVLILSKKKFKKWINDKSLEHLQKVFNPNIRVLNQKSTSILLNENKEIIYKHKKGMYNLEVKEIYKKAFYHGSANYLLLHHTNKKKDNLSFRSYKNKKHQSYNLKDNKLIKSNFYDNLAPSYYFISQLDKKVIERSKVFLKQGILKVNEYSNNYENFDNIGLCVGDTYYKSGLLREFSQAQITFNTIEQYNKIDKEIQRNKRRFNQSYEGYFINNKGKLNYYLMIETIDKIIRDDEISINRKLDKYNHRIRDIEYINHPENNCLIAVKEDLKLYKKENKPLLTVINNSELLAQIEENYQLEDSVYFEGELF